MNSKKPSTWSTLLFGDRINRFSSNSHFVNTVGLLKMSSAGAGHTTFPVCSSLNVVHPRFRLTPPPPNQNHHTTQHNNDRNTISRCSFGLWECTTGLLEYISEVGSNMCVLHFFLIKIKFSKTTKVFRTMFITKLYPNS